MSICSICPGVNVIEISELYFYTCVFSRELEERERESLWKRGREREGGRENLTMYYTRSTCTSRALKSYSTDFFFFFTLKDLK